MNQTVTLSVEFIADVSDDVITSITKCNLTIEGTPFVYGFRPASKLNLQLVDMIRMRMELVQMLISPWRSRHVHMFMHVSLPNDMFVFLNALDECACLPLGEKSNFSSLTEVCNGSPLSPCLCTVASGCKVRKCQMLVSYLAS